MPTEGVPTNQLARQCKCGHSFGAHNNGQSKHWRRGSLWACLRDDCDCKIFETLEKWADRMAQQCPHCGGTGVIRSIRDSTGLPIRLREGADAD